MFATVADFLVTRPSEWASSAYSVIRGRARARQIQISAGPPRRRSRNGSP